MRRQTNRIAVLLAVGAMTVGLLAPAASAQSCVKEVVDAQRAEFGTGFGQFVASAARNPQDFGVSNLGELVSFFATSDPGACPE